ncbi:MAG: hypothetical protein AAFQ81_09270 [Pseudomonadota bacterium]
MAVRLLKAVDRYQPGDVIARPAEEEAAFVEGGLAESVEAKPKASPRNKMGSVDQAKAD